VELAVARGGVNHRVRVKLAAARERRRSSMGRACRLPESLRREFPTLVFLLPIG
jgi:hypothetical protein